MSRSLITNQSRLISNLSIDIISPTVTTSGNQGKKELNRSGFQSHPLNVSRCGLLYQLLPSNGKISCPKYSTIGTSPSLIQSRTFHSSERRDVIEAGLGAGIGYLVNSVWTDLPSWSHSVIKLVFGVSLGSAVGAVGINLRYDPFTGRRRFLLKSFKPPSLPRGAKLLSGPASDQANEILLNLVKENQMIPMVREKEWKVFILDDISLWYFHDEKGNIFIPKDILYNLSQDEMTVLLASQMSLCVTRFFSELSSHHLMRGLISSILVSSFTFNVGLIHSFVVDISSLIAIQYFITVTLDQRKLFKLLQEGDKIGLSFALRSGIQPLAAKTLLLKLAQLRNSLKGAPKIKSMLYYEKRIQNVEKEIANQLPTVLLNQAIKKIDSDWKIVKDIHE